MIGIKPAPGDYESNFKKVSAIPCGCYTMQVNNIEGIKIDFIMFKRTTNCYCIIKV